MLSERPWKLEGIIRLVAGVLFCFCLAIVLQSLVQHFTGGQKFAEGSFLNVVFSSSLHGSVLAGTAFFLWSQHLDWSDFFGFSTPPLGRALGYGALAAIAFLPVGMALQEISIRILTHFSHATPPAQTAVQEFSEAVTWPSRGYLIFFAIILAPIAEEILFRGIIYGILRQAGFRHFALWSSSLLFAVSHGSAAIFVPLLVLGIVFAWLYEVTDNLLASITAHGLFNAINLVFLFQGDYLKEVLIHLKHTLLQQFHGR